MWTGMLVPSPWTSQNRAVVCSHYLYQPPLPPKAKVNWTQLGIPLGDDDYHCQFLSLREQLVCLSVLSSMSPQEAIT